MNTLMYFCCMVLFLVASLQCSLQDTKDTGIAKAHVVVGHVVAVLDFSTIQTRLSVQKTEADQQALLEKTSDVVELERPLSISRGGSFHGKVEVVRLHEK